jgi:serine/threonine protein kinase
MADTVGLEALVKDLEGRVARLRALEQGLGELDTAEFPEEAVALHALLKDPGRADDAERRLGELKALIQREGQRRRARRLVRAGESIPGPAVPGQQATPWDRAYELQEHLGQGGYADVYRARRLADGVPVAFKVPRGLLAGERTLSDELLRDFQREAGNWQRLNHPHIVQLYEHGAHPYPWLAMELMSGGSLTSRLDKLPVRQALDILIKVCGALEYAHSGGFVHRDLKPENILFSEDGVPKVSDWGLARHALFQSLTQGYSGSLPYSAPEQLEPERFGPYGRPGDVFQLGIVLYETLTGRHPFLLPGEELNLLSPLVVPRRIADAAFNIAPPTSVRGGIPPALDEIVLQSLRRPPRERFREVYLLREALEPVLEGV